MEDRSRTKQFKVKLENVEVGITSKRPKKDGAGNVIGDTHYVQINFSGGFVKIEIANNLIAELPPAHTSVNVLMTMEPVLEANHIEWTDKATGKDKSMDLIESGFNEFQYHGFELNKK